MPTEKELAKSGYFGFHEPIEPKKTVAKTTKKAAKKKKSKK